MTPRSSRFSIRNHVQVRPARRALRILGVTSLLAVLAVFAAPLVRADRTPLKPGVNMFSPQQDIAIGQKEAALAERQLPMLDDARVDAYLNALGEKLAGHAPGYPFPYQFRCVNDEAVNAFALPGGFIYIYRGTIEDADSEAQLAGVMAHEIAHVALRHGTNRATKAHWGNLTLASAGGFLSGMGSALEELGSHFALDSVLLKYTRAEESQADILGTQILYDSGYDSRALAQFFEKVQAESRKGRRIRFFSDHPSPAHRIERVDKEVGKMGGPPKDYKSDSDDFLEVRRYLRAMPAPPPAQEKKIKGVSNEARLLLGRVSGD
ncbi:MAG TPA: M48 family metallopeptidase [Methylomirabilota bacterium]|jgi:predicted Zn-dependent protease|nr:M48 family metallopeptidase [Methylomirabilota bacterium]